jgi:hypothetical protein
MAIDAYYVNPNNAHVINIVEKVKKKETRFDEA